MLVCRDELPSVVSGLVAPSLFDDNEERVNEILVWDYLRCKVVVHESCFDVCHKGFKSFVLLPGYC